jgi:hypothetical protein
MLGKHSTLHTKEAHKSYLMSKSLISRLAGREKMVQQLLSAGLDLSSIWEKSRARDGQREVARDKRQWGLVLQGMRPAAEARSRGRQRKWQETRNSGLCSARDETSCGLGCRRGSSYHHQLWHLPCLQVRPGTPHHADLAPSPSSVPCTAPGTDWSQQNYRWCWLLENLNRFV